MREKPQEGNHLRWVTVLFALGLMAKPQVITLPFVLLLWDYWPLQRMFPPVESSSPPECAIPREAFLWTDQREGATADFCAGWPTRLSRHPRHRLVRNTSRPYLRG